MGIQDLGVAPEWVATGDGNYTIPTGFTCIGFYVEGAGDVGVTSNGTDITPAVAANTMLPGHFTAFNATGTTATGIYALLAK